MKMLLNDRINLSRHMHKTKPVFLFDTKQLGFGIKVNPKGIHRYIVEYKDFRKRTKRVTIAKTTDLTVSEAKEKAKAIIMDKLLQLKDTDIVRDVTLDELLIHYEGAKGNVESTNIDRYKTLQLFFGDLFNVNIREFSKAYVEEWYTRDEQKKRPTSTDKAYRYMKAIFNYAYNLGYIDSNPFNIVEALGIRYQIKPKENVLFPRLDEDGNSELRDYWQAINKAYNNKISNPLTLDMIRFYLLTGIRASEIYKMRWHKDEQSGQELIEVFDTKNKQNLYIPITLEIESLLHLVENPSLVKTPRKTLIRLSNDINKTPLVTLHDLRRSSANLLAYLGFSIEEIDRFQNHSTRSSVTETHYLRREKDKNRKAIEAIENYLNGNKEKTVMSSQSRLVKRKRVGK